jgi:uroporphyrin-III C-methyltransferase/precorrin-2 dehydrogenase/sirohydrochlorin ferrochelatase/uroporphyrin-III C-methyltransferase
MGLSNIKLISSELINAGLDGSIPAAAIQDGTTQKQRKVISTLAELPTAVAHEGLQAPVMVIIGKVVALNADLDWFQCGNGHAYPARGDIDETILDIAHV